MPRYFAVRALGQDDAAFSLLFEKEVVAVGWSEVDFSKHDKDTVANAVQQHYYADKADVSPTVLGRRKAAVRRFKSIGEGDRVLVPFGNSVRLAIADGEEIYDPEAGRDVDLANQQSVTFLREADGEFATIPRSLLTERLQRRLRVRGSIVSDLGEFSDEIEGLIEHGERGWATRINETVSRQQSEFEEELLRNLCLGKTQLEAGGYGLEKLVRDLLIIEGYEADVLGKQTFAEEGDADIVATRTDPVTETRLLVQVKHHQGESGQRAAMQLATILEHEADTYEDYSLAVVTTGTPGEELLNACEEHDISTVTGSDLVRWIYDRLDELGTEWRTRLGISSVPQMAV